jgi:hypothetical protein
MKRAPAVVVSSIACVLCAVPFMACESSSGSSSGVLPGNDGSFNTPESGPVVGPEAGLDGFTPSESGADAAPPDSATVVVTKDGAADPGVTVVFQSNAGAVVTTAMTGADGKATSTVTAGDMITVAFVAAGGRHLFTYTGVKPGDVLEVVEPTSRSVQITINGNNPGSPVAIAAGNFDCSTNAASSASPVFVNLLPECITGPVFPVIGNVQFGLNSYFSFKKDVTPAASGTTTVTGMSSWTIGSPYTLNVTNAPSITGAQATLGQIANNQSFTSAPNTTLTLVGGAGTASFVVATGYADAYQGDVQFVNFPSGYQQVQSFSKRFAAGTTQTIDLAAGVLPAILSSATDATVPARPVLMWLTEAALTGTDSGVVTLTFGQPTAGGGLDYVDWSFVVPPGTVSVTAPALPASLAAFTPSAASSTNVPTVAFFESDLIPSYDFVRTHAAALGLTRVPIGIFSGAQIPALPAVGTLRITALGQGGT